MYGNSPTNLIILSYLLMEGVCSVVQIKALLLDIGNSDYCRNHLHMYQNFISL